MARRCELTGKAVLVGNRRSHAENKVKHRFLPNLQRVRLHSEVLGEAISLRIAVSALRLVDRRGGIDLFLDSMPDRKLPDPAIKLKRRIEQCRTG